MASVPGALHPPVAAAMARLAEVRRGQVVLDPCCGGGTTLAEAEAVAGAVDARVSASASASAAVDVAARPGRGASGAAGIRALGADPDPRAVAAAAQNLRGTGAVLLRADAARLPLPDRSVDRILTNPPWHRQVERRGGLAAGLDGLWLEAARVLRPGGRLAALVPLQAGARPPRQLGPLQVRAASVVRVRGALSAILVATTPP